MAEGVGDLQATARVEASHRGTGGAARGACQAAWRGGRVVGVNCSVAMALTMALMTAMPAAAQTASNQATPPQTGGPDFLSRFAFHVGIEHLFDDDPRFEWDAHWGAELDLIDYGPGALIFVAAYQTILGDEFREFDPNQGNYTLGGSASVQAGVVEVAGVFHHV